MTDNTKRPDRLIEAAMSENTARMKVRVELKETAQAIELDAVNAYTKGPFYCVYCEDERVRKFPLANIWRVVEGYGSHG